MLASVGLAQGAAVEMEQARQRDFENVADHAGPVRTCTEKVGGVSPLARTLGTGRGVDGRGADRKESEALDRSPQLAAVSTPWVFVALLGVVYYHDKY